MDGSSMRELDRSYIGFGTFHPPANPMILIGSYKPFNVVSSDKAVPYIELSGVPYTA